jgi:malate dehydrogenase (oxaloacetate-decarboxylating)(NADP+)
MAQRFSALGDIGPEAGKPVMEGKGVLFKIFADIDVFDIEINEKDPEKICPDRKKHSNPPSVALTSKTSKRPEVLFI